MVVENLAARNPGCSDGVILEIPALLRVRFGEDGESTQVLGVLLSDDFGGFVLVDPLLGGLEILSVGLICEAVSTRCFSALMV